MDVNKHETIQHHSKKQVKVKEQHVIRTDYVYLHPYPFLLHAVPLL
jgi:hypothetical protein